jgi:glyoxylase-like metal-dependent hydrolase (beta-lactamase superfamily II)
MGLSPLVAIAQRIIALFRCRPRTSIALALLGLGLGGLIWSFMPSPLPAPVLWSGPLPVASPPSSMAMYQLPTGTYATPAGLAFRGGSFSETRDFAATAILVRHPRGDLLFDTGFGPELDAQIQMLPSYERPKYQRGETARAQLAAIGYDFSALRGVVITHAHWDHVSGLPELTAPVWMNGAEQRYAGEDVAEARAFRSFSGLRVQTYTFDGPPYLGFQSSHDVWRDGSIVLVPAPGHTPGSIVAFITLPTGKRYALIGDLTWQIDGIERRAERPWMMRALADTDPNQVREDLLRIIALAGQVQVVPAHDVRAYADIPRLPATNLAVGALP